MAVLAAGLVFTLTAGARVRPKLDLVERSVGNPPVQILPGASFRVFDVVVNRGNGKSQASLTRYFLRSGATSVVVGSRHVPALKPHASSRAVVRLRVPSSILAAGYSLVACADAGQAVSERNERNNCRTARVRVDVLAAGGNSSPSPPPPPTTTTTAPPTPADSDGDGTPDTQDCAPKDAKIHPGAPDQPDLSFVDSNCDGVDGTVAEAVFASPKGNDANPGTKDKPKREIQAAVLAAASSNKDVYAAAGTYAHVAAETGVAVYGGYDPSNWSHRSGGLVTKIAGSPEGILLDDRKGVALQLLTVSGTVDAGGENAYGIRAVNSSSLTLQKVTVSAADGVNGAPGSNGIAGGNGGPGEDGKPGRCDDAIPFSAVKGGTSPAGRLGGNGGEGGVTDIGTKAPGSPGGPSSDGTPGGAGGSNGNPGKPGHDGQPGANGASGAGGVGGTGATAGPAWNGRNGARGVDGEPGHGGGGGGGGGGQDGLFVSNGAGNGGGGGGGGGAGGTGGRGGGWGGASFAIYLFNSTLVVDSSSITAGSGGAGGRGGDGGAGGFPGAGGLGGTTCTGEVGAGGNGGNGGLGGQGGGGGGGTGGPSVGIYKAGTSTATVKSSTVKSGTPGKGGAGGVGGSSTSGAGSDGVAKSVYP